MGPIGPSERQESSTLTLRVSTVTGSHLCTGPPDGFGPTGRSFSPTACLLRDAGRPSFAGQSRGPQGVALLLKGPFTRVGGTSRPCRG